MATFHLKMGPNTGDEFVSADGRWKSGTIWISGRWDSSPPGTRFHLRIVPVIVPEHFTAAGHTIDVAWLQRNMGEAGGVAVAQQGEFSPALQVYPIPDEWTNRPGDGDDDGLDDEYGLPVPGGVVAWDWVIGGAVAIRYPFNWLSPSPETDQFTVKVEVWSSQETTDSETGATVDAPDALLYELPDVGVGLFDHPINLVIANDHERRYICPGMTGFTAKLRARGLAVWVDEAPLE